MRRDATASKCFVQLVGNRELAGNEILEQPCLPASELVSFQNYAGLRGRTRTGRPYPTFHGIHKPSTCGFDFTDYGMPGGPRPSPVNRHGFEIAGSGEGAVGPDNGPGAGGMAVGRMAARAAEAKNGGRRNSRCPKGAGEGAAATPPPGRAPRAKRASRGLAARSHAPASAAGLRSPRRRPAKYFPKLSLHRRPSSRIVLLRTGA